MRNAPVYLNEFIEEKTKRELEKYKDVTKSLENPYGNAAYIRNLLQPMILVIVGFVIIVIALILHFVWQNKYFLLIYGCTSTDKCFLFEKMGDNYGWS